MTNSELRRGLLEGAVVQRADVARHVAILRVRIPGETWLLVLGAAKGACGVGLVPYEARNSARELLVGQETEKGAGKRLEGATLTRLDARGASLLAGGQSVRVFVDPGGGPRIALATRDLSDAPRAEDPGAPPLEHDACVASGRELVGALGPALLAGAKLAAEASIAKLRKRFERRAEAVRADLARASDADALAAKARWFVAEAARAPRGARELTVTDWSSGEAHPITLALDPARSAHDQVEAIFARAGRIQRGAAIARARLAEAEARLAQFDAALQAVRAAGTLADLELELRRTGPTSGPTPRPASATRRSKPLPRRPYRVFRASTGSPIWVGKGAADNDALTLHVAKPYDLWLHARGTKGAHVVLPLERGKDAPGEALVDAAHLAAHFSGGKGETSVEVVYVLRGHVRKPKGAAPGLVRVDREKVIVVRIEPARMKALLASEEDGANPRP
jgi:hypothetical protein